jgi:hypothetical protein
MKAYTHYLTMNVPGKMSFVNITGEVAECVRESGGQGRDAPPHLVGHRNLRSARWALKRPAR